MKLDREKLLELAARCEATTGRDSALNVKIALVCFPDSYPDLMNFTASLDAAMTLVPEGWTFANLSQSDQRGWWCELRRGFLTSYDKSAFGNQLENASPALALTAAALRALAGETE